MTLAGAYQAHNVYTYNNYLEMETKQQNPRVRNTNQTCIAKTQDAAAWNKLESWKKELERRIAYTPACTAQKVGANTVTQPPNRRCLTEQTIWISAKSNNFRLAYQLLQQIFVEVNNGVGGTDGRITNILSNWVAHSLKYLNHARSNPDRLVNRDALLWILTQTGVALAGLCQASEFRSEAIAGVSALAGMLEMTPVKMFANGA